MTLNPKEALFLRDLWAAENRRGIQGLQLSQFDTDESSTPNEQVYEI